jgi:hypothetical protein
MKTENLKQLLPLDARGITLEQQQTKMRNLDKIGTERVYKLSHDMYLIDGRFYNPYTDTWRNK